MPAVQLTLLIAEQEDDVIKMAEILKSSLTNAAIKENGPTTIRLCNAPSKDALMNTCLDQPLHWNPVKSFCRNPCQSQANFEDQLLAIRTCVDTINDYCDVMNRRSFTKNISIKVIPGG
eukprot:14325416-Ditylum_brightwellii.AAC.1